MVNGKLRYPVDVMLLAVVLPATAVAYVTGDPVLRSGLIVTSTLLAITAILLGLRVHRIADRMPWLLVVAGMVLLTAVNVIGFLEAVTDTAGPDTPLNELLQAGGYVALLAAAVVVVVRHAPHDRGGVIDAALIGLGTAAPVWEFVLRPRLLTNGASLAGQAVLLTQVLVLLAVLGALLRISRTSERGQVALKYMFAALTCTILGLVLSGATTDPVTGRHLPYVGVLWIWGYLFLAAAGAHPSAAHFATPAGWREVTGGIRLEYLGFVLLLNPVIGGVPQLQGQPPDGLLLSVGQLLTIPLVLTRIGQMMRQRAHDQRLLVQQATHDDLTGLANRRHLFELLDDAVRRHVDGTDPPVTLLFCDLNDFKPVNDRWGHDAGDHVLRAVATRIAACVRSGDVVARIGGDEFVVLCPGAGPAEAGRLRERIKQALVEPVAWRGELIHVGVAVGLAVSNSTTLSGDALVAAADAEMYARKRAEREARGSRPAALSTVRRVQR